MKKIICVLVLFIISCTNESGAMDALDDMGFTDIKLTGYAFALCSDKDATCTGFIAKNSNGKKISGAVGCGLNWAWAKGCTVRFNH